jgi:hypothetical protein
MPPPWTAASATGISQDAGAAVARPAGAGARILCRPAEESTEAFPAAIARPAIAIAAGRAAIPWQPPAGAVTPCMKKRPDSTTQMTASRPTAPSSDRNCGRRSAGRGGIPRFARPLAGQRSRSHAQTQTVAASRIMQTDADIRALSAIFLLPAAASGAAAGTPNKILGVPAEQAGASMVNAGLRGVTDPKGGHRLARLAPAITLPGSPRPSSGAGAAVDDALG